MAKKIGMPSKSGFKGSLVDYAVGAGGGLLYAIGTSVFGSGLIGGLLGAGIAGSVIKGERGMVLATVLGFQSIVSAQASPASADSSDVRGSM